MKKVTYLFGAGASAQAIPTVKDLPNALKGFLDKMETDSAFNYSIATQTIRIGNTPISKEAIKLRLCETIKWLIKEAREHASIDTYAKKLYLQKNSGNKFTYLKAALACSFSFMQTNNNYDRRYDTFFASIISKTNELPNNLRILSWNYDSQFEIAFMPYSLLNNISAIQSFLSVCPNNYQLHGFSGMEIGISNFAIFKLNGTSSTFNESEGRIAVMSEKLHEPQSGESIENLLFFFALMTNFPEYNNSLLTFAWEEHKITKQVIEKAAESTKDTHALVCIGYSFPFFNREIDRKIIGGMENLKTVYFQALPEHIDDNMERFKAIRQDVKVIPVRDTTQFFLPPEL